MRLEEIEKATNNNIFKLDKYSCNLNGKGIWIVLLFSCWWFTNLFFQRILSDPWKLFQIS